MHLHHERWDGEGYPLHLKGEEIPMIARILSVADSYDAITSSRAYRKAMKHSQAVDELNRCAGTQFDPSVIVAFLRGIEKHREDLIRRDIEVPE